VLLKYSRPLIIKGAPAFLTEMKESYKDSDKANTIGEVLNLHLKSMDEHFTLHNEEEEQDPTVYLWLLYFIA